MSDGMAFGMVPRHVEGKLTAMELAVYVALSWHANQHGQCWPSHRKLGVSAGCKETAVKTALNGLRDKQMISWENRVSEETGGPTSNVYTLNVWLPLGVKRPGGRRETPRGGSLNDYEQDQGTTPEEPELLTPPSASADEVVEGEIVEDQPRTTQTLIAEYVDHCDEKPPSQVIGQLSATIKRMLADDGIDYERVRNGLAEWHRRGLHPSVLPSIVHELSTPRQRPRVNGHQQQTDDMFAAAYARAQAGENVFSSKKEIEA